MTIHSAELNDLYIDGDGKLWRIVAICGEPTVTAQEVETLTPEAPVRQMGGVSGAMWLSFRKLWPIKEGPKND